jgi:hypothetical protein
VSFDAVSLFTNIPLSLVTASIELHWPLIEQNTSIPKNEFITLINLLYNNCYFSFNNNYYHQIYGSPMGSPLSPIVAQIVLDDLLDDVLKSLDKKPVFIEKYVDDLILLLDKNYINSTLDAFNNYYPSLQFTMEIENNNSIPFLDIKIIRSYNKLIFDWYTKPTFSGRFLNWFSNHNQKQKINSLRGMRDRVSKICDPSLKSKNLNKLKDIFLNNGYPDRLVKKILFHDSSVQNSNTNNNNILIYKRFPFFPNLTSRLSKQICAQNVKLGLYNPSTISKLFTKLKDKNPSSLINNSIYQINCNNCDLQYIGQSSQYLKNRLSQHKSDIKLGKTSSALSEHAQNYNHSFDFNNTKIITTEKGYYNRLFLEMFFININKKSMNYRTDICNLSNIYSNIFEIYNYR